MEYILYIYYNITDIGEYIKNNFLGKLLGQYYGRPVAPSQTDSDLEDVMHLKSEFCTYNLLDKPNM